MRRPLFSAIAAILFQSILVAGMTHAATFLPLGNLPGPEVFSWARAVSADGSVVVGYSGSPAGSREAFRWTEAGGMVSLGATPGQLASEAAGVSADGSVVVGFRTDSQAREAFRWTAKAGMTGLGDLPGLDFSSRANGVSGDGTIVVGTGNYSAGGGPHPVTGEAFRWTATDGMVGLGDVPGGIGCSRAAAISADGSTIVGRGDAQASFQAEDMGVAYRWTATGGMTALGFLPGGSTLSAATAVSADGSVVVGLSRTASDTEAFRWTAKDGMRGLGDVSPLRFYSVANGVSADGSIVVGTGYSSLSSVEPEAFIWDQARGMRSIARVLQSYGLDLGNWRLQDAAGVSADGRTIVGMGVSPEGHAEAWLARLPEMVLPVAGDTDLDGKVDIMDVAVLQTKYGVTGGATWADGDFDGNGTVDIFDVAAMQIHYGQGVAAAPAPVPEPSTMVLAAIGLVALAAWRRRFRGWRSRE
ncbi:MAG: PEP-CTERM sorting domain-containing protein [Pirellulales bacterium]